MTTLYHTKLKNASIVITFFTKSLIFSVNQSTKSEARDAINVYGAQIGRGFFGNIRENWKNRKDITLTNQQRGLVERYNRMLYTPDFSENFAKLREEIEQTDKSCLRYFNNLNGGAASTSGLTKALKSATLATKALNTAAKIGAQIGNALIGMGIGLAVDFVVESIYKIATAEREAIESAQEATAEYQDSSKSLSEYKDRISELHEELNSGNLSYSDAREKRAELMDIQDKLIQKYGSEKSAIEDINKALDGQVDALDRFGKAQYDKWFREANNTTVWQNLFNRKSGLELAKKYMESNSGSSVTFDNSYSDIKDVNKIIKEFIKDNQEMQLSYRIDGDSSGISFKGTPIEKLENMKEAKDKLRELFGDYAISEDTANTILENFDSSIKTIEDKLSEHQDTYNTYMQGQLEFYDENYTDKYADLLKKRSDLTEAQLNGDKEKEKKAQEDFFTAWQNIINSAEKNGDENIMSWLEQLYPELQGEFEQWEFKVKLDIDKDHLTTSVKEALAHLGNYTKEEILALGKDENPNNAWSIKPTLKGGLESNVNKTDYDNIKAYADSAGISIEKFLDFAENLGYLKTEIDRDFKDRISELGGDLTSNEFSDINTDELKQKFLDAASGATTLDEAIKNYQKTLEKDSKVLSLFEFTSKLDEAQNGIKSLNTAMSDWQENNKLSYSTLSSIQSEFKDVDGINDYIKKLSSADLTAVELQNTLSELTYKLIENKVGTENLTSENETLIAKLLEEQGVLNSTEVAHNMVAYAKSEAAIESYNLGDATYEEAEALINESDSAMIAEVELAKLKIAKMQSNNVTIDSDADIDNLIALANSANASVKSMQDLQRAKSELSPNFVGPVSPTTEKIKNGTYTFDYKPLNANDFKAKGSKGGVDYKGSSGSGASSTADKAKDDAKKVENAEKSLEEQSKKLADAQKTLNKTLEDIVKEQNLADFQHQIELVNQELEMFGTNLSMLDDKLNLTFESDYVSKIQTVGTQLKIASEYGADLKSELDKLLTTTPQNADEAKALADQLENLGDKYYSNKKAMIEYRNEMYSNRVKLVEEMADMSTKQTDQFDKIVDRSFSIMENGSLFGDFFSIRPLPSITLSAVEKQRKENDELIAEEKRYRDEIAKIRQQATIMEKAEDDADREEKRKEAYETFNDTVNDINDSVSQIYDNISEVSKASTDNVLSEADRMVSGVRKAVDEVNTYAANHGVDVNVKTYATPKENVNAKAEGGITSGLTLVNEIGKEGYIGEDNMLHWFDDTSHVFDAGNKPVRIISAEDMRKITQYTGTRYFHEPIGDISKVTAYADGNTSVSFASIASSSTSSRIKSTGNSFVDEIIQEVQTAFDNIDISMDGVKQQVVNELQDDLWGEEIKTALDDKLVDNGETAIGSLLLQQSSWSDLPERIQTQLSEDLKLSKDSWDEWIADPQNALIALELCKGNDITSWDLLSPSMIEILNAAGIDSKTAWETFVAQNPLKALQLLIESWDALKVQIQQYITDLITIATNGANAIHAITIESPNISVESWNNLQTVIANKIQEVLNAINETFKENNVDLNFNVNTQLSGTPGTNPQGDGTASGNAAVSEAKKYLGTPYVWGGTTPSGFDCSGFMQYVYGKLGYNINRTTYNQINDGVAVGKGSLAPGDLVFFGNQSSPHHVGMYVGNGQYIHAPRRGEVIKISNLDSRSDYACARRIVNHANGTDNAKSGYSIVGDEYLITGAKHPTPELIFKTNGSAYLSGLSGAETVKLDSGDTVVPYSETLKILKQKNSCITGQCNFNAFAKGKTGTANKKNNNSDNSSLSTNNVVASWDLSNLGRGRTHEITPMEASTGRVGTLNKDHWDEPIRSFVKRLYDSGELTIDPYGVYTYKGAYLCAATSTFGNMGDILRVTQNDGSSYHVIILDEQSQHVFDNGSFSDYNPADTYGHGDSIIEMEVDWNKWKEMGEYGSVPNPRLKHPIVKIENCGKLDGFDFSNVSNLSGGFDYMSKIYAELKKKLENILGSISTNTNTGGYKFKGYKSLSGRQSQYDFDVPFTAHANGTVKGKSKSKDLMLIGENYKNEIIGYKDGSQEVVNKPTIKQRKDVDYVIGEKDTKKISYAKGYGDMDVISEMPKLTKQQISQLLTKFKGNMSADDILNAQNSTGISALFILATAALESGWGSSAIGANKNNYWGYGATNDNPSGNAHSYDANSAASSYAKEMLSNYYNGYGLKTINQMGSGGGNGNIAYAQSSDGVASTTWAPDISKIVNGFVSSLESAGMGNLESSSSTSNSTSDKKEETREDLINAINEKLSGDEKLTTDTKYSLEELKIIRDTLNELRDNEKITINQLDGILNTSKSLSDIDKYLEGEFNDLLTEIDKETNLYYRKAEAEYQSWKSDFSSRFSTFIKTMNDDTFLYEYMSYSKEAYQKSLDVAKDQALHAQEYIKKSVTVLGKRLTDMYAILDSAQTVSQQEEAIEGISKIQDLLTQQEDKYNKFGENVKQALLAKIEAEDNPYVNAISYENKNIENLTRKIENSTKASERNSLRDSIFESYERVSSLQEQRRTEAHQRQLKMYNSDDPIIKYILENVKVDELFDANGETNSYYQEELAKLNSLVEEGKISAEYVQAFKLFVEQTQSNKKIFYDASNSLDEINSHIKEISDSVADEKIETYIKLQEKTMKTLNFRLSKQEKNHDATKSLYDFQQTLAESKLSAQLELRANKDLEQWLDPETRKLLFNEDDYSEYTSKIDKINKSIQSGYNKYINQINSLKPEEQYKEAEITAQWERQLAIKQEELDVLKDQMNVTKKTMEYNNAAKEKDTQIIMGNRVVNVADPEKLYNLAQEREQFVNEAELHNLTYSNNSKLRGMEAISDITQTQINAAQQCIDIINDIPKEARKAWAESLPSLDLMEAWLTPISGSPIRWLNETLNDYASVIMSFTRTELGDIYDASIDHQDIINKIPDLVSRGLLTQKQADSLTEFLIRYSRNDKTATSKPYKEWYNGEHSTEYGAPDEDTSTQPPLSVENAKAAQQEIIRRSNQNGGVLSKKELRKLADYETYINRQIYDNGLNAEQSLVFGEYGTKTFSDWVNNDYSASIQNMENRIASKGRSATEVELAQLKQWETDRNKKIFNDDLALEQTSKYGAEIFKRESKGLGATDKFTKDGITYSASVPVLMNDTSNSSILQAIKEGKIEPVNIDVDYSKLFASIMDGIVNNAAPVAIKDVLTSLPKNNLLSQMSSEYNFGDIILTEPVKDGNEMFRVFMDKVKNQLDLTKNMSH